MSRIGEAIEQWKSSPDYEAVRAAGPEDIKDLDEGTIAKIETILEAMEWGQIIIFNYSGSDRVVAPFAVGVSSERNPLFRGYQIEGTSKSGKVGGWRVYQVLKIEKLENHQDFYKKEEFDFQNFYPWVYKVIKMV